MKNDKKQQQQQQQPETKIKQQQQQQQQQPNFKFCLQVSSWPGGTHIDMNRICACLLGRFFADFEIAIGGFHHR